MSAVFCDKCWFRKTTTGDEAHLSWDSEMEEGECRLSRKQCDFPHENHAQLVHCPRLIKFYYGDDEPRKAPKPKPKPKPTDHEQLTLF